jgi:hypothetical protein
VGLAVELLQVRSFFDFFYVAAEGKLMEGLMQRGDGRQR